METSIEQIVASENGTIFGLGNDQKIYRWNNHSGEWQPNWRTDIGAVAPQFRPDRA